LLLKLALSPVETVQALGAGRGTSGPPLLRLVAGVVVLVGGEAFLPFRGRRGHRGRSERVLHFLIVPQFSHLFVCLLSVFLLSL